MGLQELREEILNNAKTSARKIQKESEAEAETIVRTAEEKKKQTLETVKKDVKEVLEREERERVSSARLKAKMIMAEAKESVIKELMDQLFEKMKEYRESSEYKTTLARLVDEGLGQISGKVVVYANKEDASLVKKLLGKKKAELSEEPIQCIGGVVVTSEDGKVRINNTLEAKFEERKEEVRKSIYDMVFR
ncbi:hypothetical protein HY570_02290 [Candidatus Micrarchaeota archaeon]|nr:hypothetical protein [Candidatus Micrarchaeota archaeon]